MEEKEIMDTAISYILDKKEKLRRIIQVALLSLAVLAYAGLLVVVFLYFSAYALAILVLLTFVVILGVDAWASRRKLASMAEASRKTSGQARLFKRTFLSENEVMLSSLERNIAIIDDAHYIYSIDHDVTVQGRKTTVSYTIRGRNSSEAPTSGIRYKLIGKMPANLKELDNFTASASDPDYDQHDTWEAKIIGREPYYMVVAVPFLPFNRSISPGEDFCLRLSLTWMKASSYAAGYQVFYTSNFRKGVERYRAKVTFDMPPADFGLYRVEYGPGGLDLVDEEPSFAQDPSDPKTFIWDKTSPDKAYSLIFARNLSLFGDGEEKKGD